jgi:cytochrome c-type biogenesis protein CcmH
VALAVTLALMVAALAAGAVIAQDPTTVPVTDDDVNAVAKDLYCPVCENVPLDVCGTEACSLWRQVVREKLEEGYSDREVKQYFADYYGDRALGLPPARGLNWLVYILPPVFFWEAYSCCTVHCEVCAARKNPLSNSRCRRMIHICQNSKSS